VEKTHRQRLTTAEQTLHLRSQSGISLRLHCSTSGSPLPGGLAAGHVEQVLL
jgi:hypothetical protein